jgi:peptidoglycan/LPS O-acetylase OafA/YrhL
MIKAKQYIYLPGLNGLRAIAALSVIISHISIASPYFGLGNIGSWAFAAQGVTLFFTISGFLITYLLLLEKNKQDITVKKFYIRRVLRIWPLYYLYLFIASVFIIEYFHFDFKSILFYIFLCANIPYIFGGALVLIAHLWSIGVEEQFYLFWPIIVKFTNKRLFFITLLLVGFLVLLKFYVRYVTKNTLLSEFLNVNRFECMLIGALGAMLFLNNKSFKRIISNFSLQLTAWLLLILIALGKLNTPGPTEQVLMSLITLIIIVGQINARNKIVNLENRVFDFLGKISYGLYVIHPLVIFFLSKVFIEFQTDIYLKAFLVYSTSVAFTILLAHISYKYYETPFLKLKTQFTIVKSQSTK